MGRRGMGDFTTAGLQPYAERMKRDRGRARGDLDHSGA